LLNAASVAGMMLMTEALVTDMKSKKEQVTGSTI
jgi:chaperonin GroEL (HSP60 family)